LWQNLDGGVASLPIRVGAAPFLLGVAEFTGGRGFISDRRGQAIPSILVASFLLVVAKFRWGRGFIADQSGNGSINFEHGSGSIFVGRGRIYTVAWLHCHLAHESGFTWGVASLFFWRGRAASSISGVGGSLDLPGCRNGVPRIHCFFTGDER